MNKNDKRRLLELAYLQVWGKDGSPEQRDEWHELYRRAQEDGLGILFYKGNQSFIWTDITHEEEINGLL